VQDVAHRLAASCLRLVYGEMTQASGPYIRSIEASQNKRNTIAMKVGRPMPCSLCISILLTPVLHCG
jgi:hypothetical protein